MNFDNVIIHLSFLKEVSREDPQSNEPILAIHEFGLPWEYKSRNLSSLIFLKSFSNDEITDGRTIINSVT